MIKVINKLWPLKKFVSYVFNRMTGGYLMKEIDFNTVEYKEGSFAIPNLELNTYVPMNYISEIENE